MFGFGRRKKYNSIIDTKLNNEYQIETRDNPKFLGILAYLELIDKAWLANMTEDEGALFIAIIHLADLTEEKHTEEAELLLDRIRSISEFGLSMGLISTRRWSKFLATINDITKKANTNKA